MIKKKWNALRTQLAQEKANVWNPGQQVFMHFPDKTNNILKMLQSNKNKNTEISVQINS
jgi:hypothetical protein